MYIGDMVSKVDDEWLQKNPSWLNGEMARVLFDYKPTLLGIVVDVKSDWPGHDDIVSVLLSDGSVEQFKDFMLEVIYNEETKR